MKKILSVIFTMILFFFIIQTTYAVETRQTNPLIELLNIFLNFGNSVDNAPPADANPSSESPSPIIDNNGPYVPSPPITAFFPNPLLSISNNVTTAEKNAVLNCLNKKSIYESAGLATGIPWQIIAAIHSLEAGCGSGSLVSGRAIGSNEPDVVRSGGCSTGRIGPGIPIVLPDGGCGFASLLDSAIYAGNHLKGKISKTPENFEELVKAFGRYNGTGNANCGRVPAYTNCPPLFESEDHIYPMNWFDQRHDLMYVVYCADRVKCNPPRPYLKSGAMTVLRILFEGKL